MNFLNHNTTGDGVITALQVLAIMRQTGQPLSSLAKTMTSLPQVLVNVRVRERRKISEFPDIKNTIDSVTERLGETGRVLIRYSGTEPLLRIMLEGQDEHMITAWANEIADAVRLQLGENV